MPIRYFSETPYFYADNKNQIVNVYFSSSSNAKCSIFVGSLWEKAAFTKVISIIREAGERLTKMRKEEREATKPKIHEFII
ncbi:MAG TPA: hypothetical protein DC057_10135 [Spirochaetia bacterium]|nr:hypothetical protein [Spirochaetia bacterium]